MYLRASQATSGLGFSLTTREMFLGAYTTAETSGGGCSGGGGGVGDSPGGRTNAMAGQSEGGEQLQRKPTQQHTQEQQTQKFTPIYGRAVCVKSIIPGGAALKDGTLRLGDRLMKVDREDVSTKSQAQIVSLLRVKPVGSEVELIVRRPCQPTTEDIAMVSVDPQRGFTVNADSSPLYEGYRSIGGANVLGCHCPSPNCAIRFPDYTRQVQQLGSCRLGSLDDSHLSDYPERFEKVIYLKLDIPLLQTAPLLSTQESSTTTATGTVTVSSPGLSGGGIPAGNTNTSGTVRSRLATMRLGVSVREGGVTGAFENSNWMLQGKQHVVGSAIVSEAGRIHQPPSAPRQQQSLIDPSGNSLSWGSSSVGLMSSTASGVFVKGIIEGGAAHADGRLRVGDELLEVNGISLLNTGNPLAVLRAVLKQATQAASSVAKVGAASAGTTRASSGDRTAPTLSLSRQEREEDETTFAASTPIPVIRLLVARRIRHRRSASGHTIGSNLGTEPLHSELPFDPRGEVDRLAEQYGGQLSTDSPNAPSCAVRIFANVHPLAAVATTSPCEAELPGPHRRPQVQGRESPRLGEEGRKQTAGPGVINKRPAPLLPKRPNTTTISNESAGLLPLTEAQKPAPSMQPPDERP
ncbi:unnamed protein product [Schistocephalus solidus]|uniref:Multiple PDZ domain protein n=1 Tax=Schistocephalus solidus TaxID=70667 RepID=A0A183SNI7_SCHSO|nr:unnamed protein product [Schistocephalus solidus]